MIIIQNNEFTFKLTNRLKHDKILYTNQSNQELIICDNKICYSVIPSFTLFTSPRTDGLYVVGQTEVVSDVRIRIDISEVKLNVVTGEYEKEIYTRDTTKTFHYSNIIFEKLSKIRPIICQAVYDEIYLKDNYYIDFDKKIKQELIENPTKYTTEQIHDFLKGIHENNLVDYAQSLFLFKSLSGFKESLLEVLDKDEHSISKVFKKYENILSLVLLGVDSTLTFEYKITNDDGDTVKPDIYSDNQHNELVNLIELKKATAEMFNRSEYRVNTLRIKPDFSNAIHQTNVQRVIMAQSATNVKGVIPKSILVYGNFEDEIERLNIPRDLLTSNLNILKYNNKDLIILTYDEIINRVDLIIGKLNKE